MRGLILAPVTQIVVRRLMLLVKVQVRRFLTVRITAAVHFSCFVQLVVDVEVAFFGLGGAASSHLHCDSNSLFYNLATVRLRLLDVLVW